MPSFWVVENSISENLWTDKVHHRNALAMWRPLFLHPINVLLNVLWINKPAEMLFLVFLI